MTTLVIDTTAAKQIKVGLTFDNEVIAEKAEGQKFGSQVLLPLICQLLKSKNLSFGDLDRIEVETTPGSFTGLKVGVAVANALGFVLNIPVNGKKFETEIQYI